MNADASVDRSSIDRAIALAEARLGRTGDNPAVGCVIADGAVVLSEAATGEGGRPHAEEAALDALEGRARGATAYVTLEPCGRRSTGAASCAERLIAAGVARVVYLAEDPHPVGRGGAARLTAAGVAVERFDAADAVDRLYGAFFQRVSDPGQGG